MAKLYPISTAHNHDEVYAKIGESGVSDHGALTGLGDNDHPQYRLVADAIDHGALSGLADNDHPQYLLTTGKAADSDKLDGLNSTDFGRPVFLVTPLTSTSWDGDSFSTTAKTLIDMSTEFGVPAGVKAVRLKIAIRDSGSASTPSAFQLSGISTGTNYSFTLIASEINDRFAYAEPIVPCDANGDVYYQISASGASTMDIYLEVWGYWL